MARQWCSDLNTSPSSNVSKVNIQGDSLFLGFFSVVVVFSVGEKCQRTSVSRDMMKCTQVYVAWSILEQDTL